MHSQGWYILLFFSRLHVLRSAVTNSVETASSCSPVSMEAPIRQALPVHGCQAVSNQFGRKIRHGSLLAPPSVCLAQECTRRGPQIMWKWHWNFPIQSTSSGFLCEP